MLLLTSNSQTTEYFELQSEEVQRRVVGGFIRTLHDALISEHCVQSRSIHVLFLDASFFTRNPLLHAHRQVSKPERTS
jgi:hypothetical protein